MVRVFAKRPKKLREAVVPAIDALYSWIETTADPEGDLALGRALEDAEPAWRERMISVLLKRRRPGAWAILLGVFNDLPNVVKRAVLQQRELFVAGLPRALQRSDSAARANALDALAAMPLTSAAYLLPDALCHADVEVRLRAGRLLRQMAERTLPAAARMRVGGEYETPEVALECERLVRALGEALARFDRHHRADLLEAALWYARELGDALWSKISSPRLEAYVAISERLPRWDSARLAHFLLCGLQREAWAERAARQLRKWSSAEQLTALLRHSRLLNQPEMRGALRRVINPAWFDNLHVPLPKSLLRYVPRWIVHAGYADDRRQMLLQRFLRSHDAQLQRAAVYAVGESESRVSRELLRTMEKYAGPLGTYARWWLAGRALLMRRAAGIRRDEAGNRGGG